MKKFLITLMCVVMIIAMMPAMAFAEGEVPEGDQPEVTADDGDQTGEGGQEEGGEPAPVAVTGTGTAEDPYVVSTAADLKEKMEAGGYIQLSGNIKELDADNTITIASGKTVNLDLNDFNINGATKLAGNSNREMFLVKGNLTVSDGTITMTHGGDNMGWNAMAAVFDVTGGGVLNMEGVVVNVNGTDMNFCVHLNNWGEVTLNANNCVFDATYCGVRVNNSGYDMNNVTIKNSTLKGGTRAFWVHNYIGDLNSSQHSDEAINARLKLDIYNNNNKFEITGTATTPIRYGFADKAEVFFTENGVPVSKTADAFKAAVEAGDTVVLGSDITLSETVYINKNVIINGNDKTITSTADKAFRINDKEHGEAAATDVTFQNVTITSAASNARCIDTRAGGLKNLTLTNVTLNTTSTANNQPITISGTAAENEVLNVTMTDCDINAGVAGYGIIVFVPADITINNSSAIAGYSTLYFKDGSAGSEANIQNGSNLTGKNNGTYEGANSFGTVFIEEDGITVNVENATLNSETTNTAYEAIIGFKSGVTGNVVNFTGTNTVVNTTGEKAVFTFNKGNNTIVVNSGKYAEDVSEYLASDSVMAQADGNGYYVVHVHLPLTHVAEVKATYSATGTKEHYTCNTCKKLYSDAEGKTEVTAESLVIPKLVYVDITPTITPTPSAPKDEVVTNTTTNTDTAGTTTVAPTTNANVSASTTTTKTETGEVKTETKVEQTVADKIVEKAVENKSEEVVIDTTTKAPTTGTTTAPAEETKAAEVVIPTETIEKIADQTEAAVTIKTDVAEIKLDNAAATAIAEQAADDGTISIVAVKTDEVVVEEETVTGETEKVTEVHFELKVVCSERGVIGDFQGGTVTVTVPVPKDMNTEELVAVYIDAQGHYHRVTGVKNANGTFTFVTDHFSSYAVMTAEEAEAAIEAQKEAVKNTKFKLSSKLYTRSNGKKAIKLTWSGTDLVFDGVEFQRSMKKNSGYGKTPYYTTKENAGYYNNTAVKEGNKYYYRARGFVTIDGEKVYTQWSYKAWRTVK